MNFLYYGLQRAGTNYLKELINLNFQEPQFLNDGFYRSLPLHKHFRLYSEKWFIPNSAKFYNNFHYQSIREFNDHVEQLTGHSDVKYIVIVKEPYSWYLSVREEAKKNRWPTYQSPGMNPNFIIEYNLFYGKWLQFQHEAPEQVFIVNYENFILDFDGTLQRIADHFGLTPLHKEFQNKRKVKRRAFTDKQEAYYRNSEYMSRFDDKEIFQIYHNLQMEVVKGLGYELAEPAKQHS